MPDVQNQPEIFGEQCKMDEGDGIVGYEPLLLTTAADISIDDVAPLVKSYGGACFPAHLDRASYSVLSVLGFLYPELNFTAAEFTPKEAPVASKHASFAQFGRTLFRKHDRAD